MTKEKTTIRNKELAKLMKEYCPSYHAYEYEDFLEVFAAVIPRLVLEDSSVRLKDLGEFYPKHGKDKVLTSGFTGEAINIKGATTMGFTVSRTIQKNLREKSLQKIVDLTKEIGQEL